MARKLNLQHMRPPESGQRDHASQLYAGLWLRHFASGRKTWFMRGRVRGANGRPLFIVLGEPGALGEDEAGAKLSTYRGLLRDGIDPTAHERAERAKAKANSMTFGDLRAEYLEREAPKRLRPGTLKQWRYRLHHHWFDGWVDRPLSFITADRIEDVARQIGRNSQGTYLGPVRRVLRYAKIKDYVEHVPEIKIAQAEGNAAPLARFQIGKAIDWRELVALLECLDEFERANPLSPWPAIFRFGAFTGMRVVSVVRMRWSDLELGTDRPLWHLRADISKVKRDSDVPLSNQAASIVRAVQRGDGLVWPGRGGRPLAAADRQTAVLGAMLAARGFPGGFTYGRLRDTMATWLTFQMDAPERAMNLILNHRAPRSTMRERHYVDIAAEHQARVLLERFAAEVSAAKAGRASKQVIALRR